MSRFTGLNAHRSRTPVSANTRHPGAVALLAGVLLLLVTAPVTAQTRTFSVTEKAVAAEGESAYLAITLSEDSPAAGVTFTVAAGFGGSSTAEAADVMSIDSPVTVPGGTRTLSISIPLADDFVDEDVETFTVTIATTAEGWSKVDDGKDTAVVAIYDDDNAGVNFIGVDRGRHVGRLAVYQHTPASYQLVLTSRPVSDVTIEVSASFLNKVTPASHTFAAGSANDWREPKEFTVIAGGRIGSAVIIHTVTSADPNYTLHGTDWSPPSDKLQLNVYPPLPTRLTLSADPMPAEGEGAVTVTATLDNPAPVDGTTVRLTLSGTAIGEGTDYTLSSTTISIRGTRTTGTATITVIDDSTHDEGETIVLDAASTNPPLVAQQLTLTISDNDGGGEEDGGGDEDGGDGDNGGGGGNGSGDGGEDDGGDEDGGGDGGNSGNQPPTAMADTARTVEDVEVLINVLANDTDFEGDALMIESVTAPSKGTARIAADGRVSYAPEPDWHGTDRFSYTVSDGNGGTAEAKVVVVVGPVNDAPVAVADTARTSEDEEVLIGVLANDADAESDALRIESVSAPSNGTARIAAEDAVSYAPAADWHGPDRFDYTVSDGNGGTAEAEVVVMVESVDDAPVAAADTARTSEDVEVLIDVLANDVDVESDGLRIESVTAPSNGTSRIAADGRVSYAPEPDWHGTDRFVYRVSDGNGGTAEAEVVVEVAPVNDAPVAVADTARTSEDVEVLIDVLANDVDVESDGLRIESVTAPSNGTARIAADGRVSYAPEPDWHGTDRFAYRVSDGNGGTAEAEVVVMVESVNDAPVAVSAIPDQSLDEGGAYAVLDLTPYFEDPDGDALTYLAGSSDPGLAAVAVAGSMLTVTPVGYGQAFVEVTARDPGGLETRQVFRVGTSDRKARMVLDETLAAMARAHLASARMTLGRRVGSGGAASGSMLTVMGRRVPLSRTAALEAAGRMLEHWALARRLRNGGLRNTDMPMRGARGGTEWAIAFGSQEGSARPGGPWRFWGQGDIQTFAGEPSPEQGYEGDLRTGWAGIDRALGARWLVGVAVAQSTGGSDWRSGSAAGSLYTTLTAVYPHLNWSDGVSSVWAMTGGGRGSAENTRDSGRVGESGLSLALGAFEVRRRFADWFGLRADAAWARLATGEGKETVDGRSAVVDQQRLGIEWAPSSRLGYLDLEPFVEASVRRDGGAGQTGSGLELSGGLRAAGGLVRVDAHGRVLVLHSADGYAERGLGVTVSVGRQAAAEGLSLSVSPRWGGPASATGVLWREQLSARPPSGRHPREAWSLDAAARYGQRLPGGRLLEWYGSFIRTRRDWRLNVGVGFGLPAAKKHDGRRTGHAQSPRDHRSE